jgi:hypothetical protein
MPAAMQSVLRAACVGGARVVYYVCAYSRKQNMCGVIDGVIDESQKSKKRNKRILDRHCQNQLGRDRRCGSECGG